MTNVQKKNAGSFAIFAAVAIGILGLGVGVMLQFSNAVIVRSLQGSGNHGVQRDNHTRRRVCDHIDDSRLGCLSETLLDESHRYEYQVRGLRATRRKNQALSAKVEARLIA